MAASFLLSHHTSVRAVAAPALDSSEGGFYRSSFTGSDVGQVHIASSFHHRKTSISAEPHICSTTAGLGFNVPQSHKLKAYSAAALRISGANTPLAQTSGASSASSEEITYHFCVANAKFMLDDEEQFQELMKERLRHFGEMGRKQDFWLLYEPEFLERFPDIANRVKRPAVALVSTDKLWMTFMKLRMDRVLKGEYEAATVEAALDSKPVTIQFDSPGKWVAPYPKYEGPWWTPFLPPQLR